MVGTIFGGKGLTRVPQTEDKWELKPENHDEFWGTDADPFFQKGGWNQDACWFPWTYGGGGLGKCWQVIVFVIIIIVAIALLWGIACLLPCGRGPKTKTTKPAKTTSQATTSNGGRGRGRMKYKW